MKRGSQLVAGAVTALVAVLFAVAPGWGLAAGRVYYVAPAGDDAHEGSQFRPWKTVRKAAQTAEAGDTVIFRAGVYRETLQPTHSGTGEDARIVFKAAPDEEVVLEGGSDRINGWEHEGENIYRKAWPERVEGVFVDTYETAGKYCCLWDMGNFNVYGANPNFELHDFDPSHDYHNGRQEEPFKMHDWRAQYKHANGVLRVRTHDGRSPDEHDVRVASLSGGILIVGKSYITVEGIKVRRFRNSARVEQSPNTRLINCDMRYSARNGIWMNESDGSEILNCVIQGGGSWIGHYEDAAGAVKSVGTRWEGNDISYGGHGGLLLSSGCHDTIIRKNYIHDSGGTLLNITRGSDRSLVEENVIARAPFRAETSLHKVPHGGIGMHGLYHVVQRNLVYHAGTGLSLAPYSSSPTRWNRVVHNTIYGCEEDGLSLQGYAAREEGNLNENYFANNLVVNCGTPLRLDLPGGDQGDFWGNRFDHNCFWHGKIAAWTGRADVAEAEQRWPFVFRSNLEADPWFTNIWRDDYTLQWRSPAIDRGLDIGLPFEGLAPDIGAFERPTSLFPPLVPLQPPP